MLEIRRDVWRRALSVPAFAASHPGWSRWIAHLLFWLIYFGLRTAAASANPPPSDTPDFPFMANRALNVASFIVVTGGLLALIAGPGANKSGSWRNMALVGAGLLMVPLGSVIEEFWPRQLMGVTAEMAKTDAWKSPPLEVYFFNLGWVLPLWGLTQALLGYHFQMLQQQRAVIRAQALAHDAQLRMLHYQINPHFLFNTLNAISTLVLDGRGDKAERMLMGLSAFLRYSLDQRPSELAPLSAELDAQRRYLEIEQTRFGEKLSVRFDVEPGLERVRLPSLILQPILENAIKYAITPSAEGGHIEVRVRREGALVRISVEDDGPGISADAPRARAGVGLANARERLLLIFGEAAGLSVENREPRGCKVEMWMPFQEETLARTLASTLS